ncbi:hypothetical protein [Gaoshiqia sp. Z1-71]|uniref:hypothetical protein n=1 Tax=Gaoshiqia hydrogeniformans TaxID=3290090 RepID=UPI003BF82BA6
MDTKKTMIGFALAKITTEQFAALEDNLPHEGKEVGIALQFRFSAEEKGKMIGVFTNFAFQVEGKPFLIVEGGCHFKIKPEDWNAMLSDDQTELTAPADLLRHLATIAVGTTRGILHAKTENTSFNKYHLPTINVVEVVNKDSLFKFEKGKV